ncbi:Bifunctional protein PutA [Stieleria bergensis]|uniref:L-glutamate gamma-semialdehyde dehydrogenase n=1 Tax=Stieleria bergensis TaxID=2528025 RepID=A0A517SXG4_9BACT|nr:Bifunctional protein PutA [Planctomycetes bacterium SV_7m_r]
MSAHDVDRAIELAAELLTVAAGLQTASERRQQAELDRMIGHDEDKATLVEMTDQAFRTHTPARVADQLTHLLDVQGVPRFFSPVEQAMLRGFQSFGAYLPGVAVPLVKEKMRRETANVILPADPDLLRTHLQQRQQQGVQMNLNLLGEAILGQRECKRRIDECLDALRMPDVACLSVKISTVYSQVSALAREHTITKVSDRLELLYRTALQETTAQTGQSKFLYLDMEEYRDLYLTADVLREVLRRPGLEQARAGIALQAYIPDSFPVLLELIEWSAQRVREGGLPLTIRLVKGANMEMERVYASIAGHPQAPYQNKLETDANYKRMLRHLLDGAASGAVRVGVASHNLFDVALALLWADERSLEDQIQIEMLEGMANHQRRALSDRGSSLLLYAPACRQDGFLNAIGYLVRRLDENTGPENFLRHTYRLTPDSEEFDRLAEGFRQSYELLEQVSGLPRFQTHSKTCQRSVPPDQPPPASSWDQWVNEPDTNWAIPSNVHWVQEHLNRWHQQCDERAVEVPLMVAGDVITATVREEATDPSRPETVVCRFAVADQSQVQQAVQAARKTQPQWAATDIQHRQGLLRQTAQNLRLRRGDLLGAMVADAGKTVAQADPEISEAIDFCEFYPLTVQHWSQDKSLQASPRGVVSVITPWNFPLAIPCGGVAAALAAGNCVILKPAHETVLTAWLLCNAFWDAGVPREVLQMIPCADEDAESGLVKNRDIDVVILTGGTATAKRMLSVRPDLHLLAETGGKNATIVTAMADRDQAVKHVIESAFGHGGQKCSATSLLLLEDEVFEDPVFRDTLADAVESLIVGSSWDLSTAMGPLIHPPGKDLTRGLKTLEDGESWLVVPEHVVGNPNLYRPGIKWNLQPGSFTHRTELFGPVLGVMRYSRLEEAIEIVRRTGYGLTSGIESLDEREIELWKQTIHAGNLYVNRSTTGAIVLRQPFGGVGLSAYGPGVKAGGPHYVLPLMHLTSATSTIDATVDVATESLVAGLQPLPDWLHAASQSGLLSDGQERQLASMIHSVSQAVETEFSQEHDSVRLVGQDNLRRYRSPKSVTVRVDREDDIDATLLTLIAAIGVQTQVTVSIDPELATQAHQLLDRLGDAVPGVIHPMEESGEQLAERIAEGDVDRLRALSPLTRADQQAILTACAEQFVTVIIEPVLAAGRIECLRYLDEQSVSVDYHRYGNLGRRAGESRCPVA